MTQHKKQHLKFKEFDYKNLKKQLPDGIEPIPYVTAPVNIKRHPLICVHGLSTYEAAIQFISQHASFFPPNSFTIQKYQKNVFEYEYQVIAPYELSFLMKNDPLIYPTIVVKSTPYNNAAIPIPLYRTIGAENVEKLFKHGELLLSTFKRCRTLENDARRDKYELRNIVEIIEGTKKMEIDVGFDDSLLLLCTSLPPINEDTDLTATIRITDVSGFFKEITKTLVSMGFSVAEILYGPCVYNDKVISIETNSFISDFEAKIDTTGNFPSQELMAFINKHVENDIIMNKPFDFVKEQEYRLVWKLVNSFNEEKLLIRNPDLTKYCERMEKNKN